MFHDSYGTRGVFLLLPLLGVFGGCATLKIDVAVYKGPVADTLDSRIDRAVGLARTNAKVAEHYKAKGLRALFAKEDDFALLRDLEGYHGFGGTTAASLNIPVSAAGKSAEDKLELLSDLGAYSQHCQSVARRLGYAELLRFPNTVPVVRLFTLDVDYLAALVDIDENSRLMDALVATARLELEHKVDRKKAGTTSPTDDFEYGFESRINHIMASASPGSLMLAVREGIPLWSRGKVDRIYDRLYWGEINPIRVAGMGNVLSMLVMDDIGNWHLKKVDVDPQEIINVARKVAELAITATLPAKLPTGT